MKRKLDTLSIPFPLRLMSTSRTPTNMPAEFAREILNMYARENGAGTKRNGVVKVGSALGAGSITRLMFYVTPAGDTQILAYTDDGKIHLQSGDSWVEKAAGLDITGTIRWTHFAGRLIVCNGLDNVLSWDGSTFTPVAEWVTDQGANLTYVSATQLTIESDISLYPVGKSVRARLGAGSYVESTVASVSDSSGTLTVTLNDAVLTNALDELAYEAKPPAFAYVYAAHDRLWGFGKGPLQAGSFSATAERSFVYYTHGVNDETAWHNDSGILQYINMADKMPTSDELVAMAVKDGLTVFLFRNHIQVWAGDNPTVSGNFTWNKTIPLGAIHGDLVVEMPNDIGFFTRFGARTLSRLLQTEQLDISDLGSEIDPTIATAVQTMLASDAAYRNVQAFQHDRQGWFGFKPSGAALVFQISGSAVGWSLFDGAFEDASAFLNTPDGALYMAVGGQLLRYDETVFDDDGAAVTTRWWTPWLNASGKLARWANKYVQVISEQGVPLLLSLKRYKNYNSGSFSESQASIQQAADYWNEADWDEGLWDNAAPRPEFVRDHYVADVFAYAVESTSTDGPLTLFGIKLYGIKEK